MLKRPTAIKLLPPQLADSERQACASSAKCSTPPSSQHHNTVAIYDYGTQPRRRLLLRDGIRGRHHALRDGRPHRPAPRPRAPCICSSRRAARWRRRTGSASSIAIIKPANLMVSHKPGMWDHLKVLDFGLVKVQGGCRRRLGGRDRAGQRAGHAALHLARGHPRHRVGGCAQRTSTRSAPSATSSSPGTHHVRGGDGDRDHQPAPQHRAGSAVGANAWARTGAARNSRTIDPLVRGARTPMSARSARRRSSTGSTR